MRSLQTIYYWDIFCRVIDNHGDLGVCWRLSADLAERGQSVRLWVDDATALQWMAPNARQPSGVRVYPWPTHANDFQSLSDDHLNPPGYADVVIEAFGCDLPEHVQDAIAQATAQRQAQQRAAPLWINLEYLSAEAFVERQHGLPSPVMSGPAQGCTKRFFYPGFTSGTGGLIRERDLLARQNAFDLDAWRIQHAPGLRANGRLISLFCYEPAGLGALLKQLDPLTGSSDTLLITPGRPIEAVQAAWSNDHGQREWPNNWRSLAHTDQIGFDHMLWACDLNLVRGEDSLVRALWAGQAFVWHIYPQHDDAHHAKLQAFLDWLDAPASLRRFHAAWNGLDASQPQLPDAATLREWTDCAQAAKRRLMAQADLVGNLLDWVNNNQRVKILGLASRP